MNEFLKTDKLTVGYDGIPLISDIDFNLKRGEILTLIGANGSGKSTILKSITNHLKKISGVVYLENLEMDKLTAKERAKKMSVVLTERIRPELMTCREIVSSGRYPYTNSFGKLTEKDNEIVDDCLEKVHALDIATKNFNEISDGQRQRILLARSFAQEPEIIVLDEPTSFLDIKHKTELLNILREMAKQKNIAIVMSLHEIDFAYKVSDYVACVKGDTIGRIGTPEEVFENNVIDELYDLPNGSYNVNFGSVELNKAQGSPKVFVFGGGSFAIKTYRLLQKKSIPFVAGILWENETAYEIARSLASLVITVKPFMEVDENTMKNAIEQLKSLEYLLIADDTAGTFNKKCFELVDKARELGVKIIQNVGEIQ
ncbi:MAG: ABC transporter ATP-binding protein [Clostridia bacterium]